VAITLTVIVMFHCEVLALCFNADGRWC